MAARRGWMPTGKQRNLAPAHWPGGGKENAWLCGPSRPQVHSYAGAMMAAALRDDLEAGTIHSVDGRGELGWARGCLPAPVGCRLSLLRRPGRCMHAQGRACWAGGCSPASCLRWGRSSLSGPTLARFAAPPARTLPRLVVCSPCRSRHAEMAASMSTALRLGRVSVPVAPPPAPGAPAPPGQPSAAITFT